MSAAWSSLVAIELAWVAVVVLPGPNFLAVGHAAMTRSRRAGLAASAGVGVGTTIWAVASLAGLGALLSSAHWLSVAVKLAGATYLVVYGLSMLRSARRPLPPEPATAAEPTGPPDGSPEEAPRLRGSFLRGLSVDLSNPKAAVFFTSLFAVAAPVGAPLWFQALLVAVVAATAAVWYGAVALTFALEPARRAYRRAQRTITATTGALLTALGVRLATQD